MMSSNGYIFHVTGPLCGEFSSHWGIPLTKASDTELFFFFFICAWTNGWVNERDASDLRCHCAHHDITVMFLNENAWHLTTFFMNIILWDRMDDKSTLVYIMAWCQTGTKPLFKPMVTQISLNNCMMVASHYLIQWWFTVNKILKDILQYVLSENTLANNITLPLSIWRDQSTHNAIKSLI